MGGYRKEGLRWGEGWRRGESVKKKWKNGEKKVEKRWRKGGGKVRRLKR